MSLSDAGPIYLVGAGKMGMALARGWLAAGVRPFDLVLVDPQPSEITRQIAAQHGVNLEAAIPHLSARILVVAVKPQMLVEVYPALRAAAAPDTFVVSIVAGVTIKNLVEGCGTERVIRTMPNLPAQVGKGVTGIIAGEGTSEHDRMVTGELLGANGDIVWLESEDQIDALTAISGCGPAYVFHMVEAMAKAGAAQGLNPEQAMVLARQTVIGAAALMENDPTDAAELRENVTSPNGVTAEALKVLMAPDGLEALMGKAIDAAVKRNRELGR